MRRHGREGQRADSKHGPCGARRVRLEGSFENFRAAVAREIGAAAPEAVALFFFRGRAVVAERQLIVDDATLHDFARARRAVWVFELGGSRASREAADEDAVFGRARVTDEGASEDDAGDGGGGASGDEGL